MTVVVATPSPRNPCSPATPGSVNAARSHLPGALSITRTDSLTLMTRARRKPALSRSFLLWLSTAFCTDHARTSMFPFMVNTVGTGNLYASLHQLLSLSLGIAWSP